MNTACLRSAEELTATIAGNAWHGDSVRDILRDVTARQARARPIPDAHSIWEIVLHLDAWVQLFLGALQGIEMPAWATMPAEQDWPRVEADSEEAWERCVRSLLTHHAELAAAIAEFADDRLEATVPGRTYDFNRLFQSASLHAAYHAGQIVLLKKLTTR